MILMGTLGGFPNPPAFWLRRAKPGYAYAIMGTLGGGLRPRSGHISSPRGHAGRGRRAKRGR